MTLQQPTDTLDIRALLTDGTQLIGGEFAAARGGETIAVLNPATEDVLAHVPRSGAEDVADAVAAAQAAFPAWRDVGKAVRLARRIEAGQVSINTLWSGGVIGAPFGGYKSSDFGRTVSAESILDYTQVKSVIIDGRA